MGVPKWLLNLLVTAVFAVMLVAFLPANSQAQTAKELYGKKCESCHGPEGKGDGPAGKYISPHPANFAKTLKGKSDDWIFKAIKHGGTAVGEAAVMPAAKGVTDEQIHELVKYVKGLASKS